MAPPLGTTSGHNGLRAHEAPQLNSLGHSLGPYDYSSVRAHNPQVLQSLSATSQQQVRYLENYSKCSFNSSGPDCEL